MKIMLIFPPQSQPFLPHPALPALSAVLKKNGHEVILRDYNLDAYRFFLSPAMLEKAGISSFVASQSESILKHLRTGLDYCLPSDYYGNIQIIQDYLTYVSRCYPGSYLDLKDFTHSRYDWASSEDILKAVADRQSNMFIDFYETKMDEIREASAQIVGISVSWPSQMIPAFTLSHMIKKNLPDVHVTMGGSMISHLADYLKHKRKMFSLTDSFIPFEGEIGLARLADNIFRGRPDLVPGLIYAKKKKVVFNAPEIPESLDDLPSPDFDGLETDQYLSLQPYLPVAASRGCYWSGCTFCTHHHSSGKFRKRKAGDLFREMKDYQEKYNCRNFYFVDDAIPPATARELALMIKNENLNWRWMAEFRMEPMMDRDYFDVLYAGGCRMAMFGLESCSQRVLDLMNKGWPVERAEKVIQSASESGLITWVFFFLGFPGERRNEARQTLRFLADNSRHIDMVAGGSFVLTRNSAVFKNTEKFGVAVIDEDKEKDLKLSFSFKPAEGMDNREARDLLARFKRLPAAAKFMESFISEPHLLFFRKSYFSSKNKEDS